MPWSSRRNGRLKTWDGEIPTIVPRLRSTSSYQTHCLVDGLMRKKREEYDEHAARSSLLQPRLRVSASGIYGMWMPWMVAICHAHGPIAPWIGGSTIPGIMVLWYKRQADKNIPLESWNDAMMDTWVLESWNGQHLSPILGSWINRDSRAEIRHSIRIMAGSIIGPCPCRHRSSLALHPGCRLQRCSTLGLASLRPMIVCGGLTADDVSMLVDEINSGQLVERIVITLRRCNTYSPSRNFPTTEFLGSNMNPRSRYCQFTCAEIQSVSTDS